MKVQLVCGTFDDKGGHYSKIGEHVNNGLDQELEIVQAFNGGHIETVPILKDMAPKYNAVVWMPNISNSVPVKYVDEIKKLNKRCVLVVSKRNDYGKYSLGELIESIPWANL